MEAKKTAEADVNKKATLFLAIGLLVSLGITLMAFEWKQYEEGELMDLGMVADDFEEDYSDKLTDEERLARFGQEDHVRVFGRKDFESMFLEPNFEGFTRIALHDLISHYDARKHAIRIGSISPKSTPQTFVFIKD